MFFTYLNKNGTQHFVDIFKGLTAAMDTQISGGVRDISDAVDTVDATTDNFIAGLDWKESVATYNDLATTYPDPQDGWTVNVRDTNYTYRYTGSEWIPISANSIPDATELVNGLMTPVQVQKLNQLENYTLPVASRTTLGGIKPDGTSLVVDENGVATAIGANKRIGELYDVQISNLEHGDILTYDGDIKKWRNVKNASTVVEISDVIGATVYSTTGSSTVYITWTDPEDVVVEGAVLAKWAGTKIVRKVGSAPQSENDGTLVTNSTTKNAYSSTPFEDRNLSFDVRYYYRFFPYTETGAVTSGSSRNIELSRISINVPTVISTLTYDGTAQHPTFSSETGFTIGGTTSAIAAGTYTVVLTLNNGYIWSDGTLENKTVQWTINKADASIIATPSSVELNASHLSDTVIITNLLDREILSVVSSDEDVCLVSLNNNIITITSTDGNAGDAIVTITTGANQNYNASSVNVLVSANFVSEILNKNSWQTINEMAVNNTASTLWNVGDRKGVVLNGSYESATISGTYYLYILGFNHNESNSGGGCIHFQFGFSSLVDGKNIMIFPDNFGNHTYINAPQIQIGLKNYIYNNNIQVKLSNDGGWGQSLMRKRVLSAFKNVLPTELLNVLSIRKIYTDNAVGNEGTDYGIFSSVGGTYDDVFLPGYYELYTANKKGINQYEKNNNLQKQYDYYKNGNAVRKYRNTDLKDSWYWLRSRYCLGDTGFPVVQQNDNCYWITAPMTNEGFAPIFIVGKKNYSDVPSWGEATDSELAELLSEHYDYEPRTVNLLDHWNVGDERIVHLGGEINEDVTLVILHKLVSYAVYNSSKTCSFSFVIGQKNCLSTSIKMYTELPSSYTTYARSNIFSWLENTYKASMPQGLNNLFQHVNPYGGRTPCAYTNTGTAEIAYNSTYFLPTQLEMLGTSECYDGTPNYADWNYNAQFDYYKTHSARKKAGDNGNTYVDYWTRFSMYPTTSSDPQSYAYQCISANGEPTYAQVDAEKYIAPIMVL